MTYSRNRHMSREDSLGVLEHDKIYIVEGDVSGIYNLTHKHVMRFALENVLVRHLDKNIRFENSPAITTCGHINCIRKKQGMEYEKLSMGKHVIFLGIREDYQRSDGTKDIGIKVYRDSRVKYRMEEIEERIRKFLVLSFTRTQEQNQTYLDKVSRMIEELQGIISEFPYVPVLTISELNERIHNSQLTLNKHQRCLQFMSK